MSDRFTTFRSTFEALRAFPAEDMKKVYIMMGEYALDGILPEAEPTVAYGLFCSIKPLIDASIKRSQAGRSGGEATQKQSASKVQANLKQNRSKSEAKPKQTAPDSEAKIKDKSIKIKEENIYSTPDGDSSYPYEEIISYLNQKAGTSFRASSQKTQTLIRARFKEKFTLEDFKRVIDSRCEAWKGDAKMSEYLRPETLFGTKFESYLNAKPGYKTGNKFSNFESRRYDYDELERKLTGVMS